MRKESDSDLLIRCKPCLTNRGPSAIGPDALPEKSVSLRDRAKLSRKTGAN